MPDWTETLTEEERAELERGWPIRNMARTVAALRALVEEKDRKFRKAESWLEATDNDVALAAVRAGLALNEDDMRKRLK